MIGWEMAEILHFEILRKHGQTNTQTNKQTHKQTNRHGHYNTSPSPYGGRGNKWTIPNLYDHSFPRYGQITFLTFRRPTTLTFDLKFWKYLSVTVYPYVICMPSFIMIGWEMADILHFEILRKHGQTNTQTNKQTHKQTNRHGHYNTSPSPYGGRGNKWTTYFSYIRATNIVKNV